MSLGDESEGNDDYSNSLAFLDGNHGAKRERGCILSLWHVLPTWDENRRILQKP